MTKNEILHLIENYGSIDKAAKHSGMGIKAFRKIARAARLEEIQELVASGQAKLDGQELQAAGTEKLEKAMDRIELKYEPTTEPETSIESDRTKDGQVITLKSSTVRTEAQAIAAAEIDLNVWDVERCVINKWDVGAKNAEKQLTALELWQVKLFLKRKMPKPISDAITEMLSGWKFEIPIYREPLPIFDRHLLEISLYDAHFGKLCWGPETLNSGDLKTSRLYYQQAGERLLSKVAGYPIDRILLPIGNDFFHINNWINTTGKGTVQDVDSRLQKIFDVGTNAVINLINRCVQVAPVDVMWVPGNHDPETSWFMAKVIEAYYRNTPEVRVNTDPTWRKYLHYGTTLLGYTHGNEEKESDLPTLMAVEQPDLWARSTCRGWRLGHFHTKRQRKYTSGDTINGVTVDYLPSLSATDAWHFRKGYVGNPKAGEAWLWSHDEGYAGQFPARVG